MSDRRTERTRENVHRALLKVARRFEKDPTPTDGSFQAALEKLGMTPRPRVHKNAVRAKVSR